MAIRVGPTEKNPTHHIKLTDVDGNSVGLILCNDAGDPAPMYVKSPVMRTALKTTSGGGSYADYNTPYSPIVQDNWSGGRANLDYERDTTRFFDSYRVTTRRENVAFLGPKEYVSKGYRSMDYNTDERYNHYRELEEPLVGFTASASYTCAKIWLRLKNNYGEVLTVDLMDSTATTVLATGTATPTQDTILGEWIAADISYALVSGTTYIIRAYAYGHTPGSPTPPAYNPKWQAVDNSPVTMNYTYRIEPAAVEDNVIYYQYRGQQYKVISPDGGTPTVWMNGDRGVADSNAGQLNKVIDATKTWTTNQWAGCIVKIFDGTGITESQLHRTIISNTATELVCDSSWTIQHDTSTNYVILGSDTWRELTGHGLTAKVTDVLSMPDSGATNNASIYFAQGDSVLMRVHREYNNAGVWTETDWAAEAAGSYATFLAYQPLANKIWRAQNRDATSQTSVSSATPTSYGTPLTFSAVTTIGNATHLINGIEVYPSDGGTEALWVFKEHLAFIVTTQAEGIKLDEMRHVRSRVNGTASMVHNVYLYFNLGNGLERYYGGNIEDLGPNLEQGLPTDRDGPIKKLMGYPGRIFALIDAGSSGYSSLLERSGGGWHEVYRAPYGQRLKGMDIQVIPGDENADRLWLYQGNTSVWLNLSSNGTNELKDTAYRYTSDGAIILSTMHAGLYDVQKIVRVIKVWTDNLAEPSSGDPPMAVSTIAVDYKLDGGDWVLGTETRFNNYSNTINFGLAGKSIQFRIRIHTGDDTESPLINAVIVDAVTRSDVKYFYNLQFRVMDDEPTLAPREMDDNSSTRAGNSAITKLTIIENWGDSATEGLLYMESNSPLYNGKYVFINPPVTRQIGMDPSVQRDWTGNAYICSTNAQEA